MKLKDILDSLAYGELSNLFIGESGEDGIPLTQYPKLLNSINLGLTDLYTRFPLKENELKLKLTKGIYTYNLKKEFAENNLKSVEDELYIIDDEDKPFEGDIIKVERVYTDKGLELPLNDEYAEMTLRTPTLYTLTVPKEIVDKPDGLDNRLLTDTLRIVYRAVLPTIEFKENIKPSKIEIDLPYTHLQALLYFVASRLHNPIGLQQDFHTGNSYAAKYERECQRLEAQNIRPDQGMVSNTRLERGGWV